MAGYRLIAQLGQGGTADVFLAFLDGPRGAGAAKLVVLKRLRQHVTEDSDFITMLLDEARLTSRLSHANVVQLLDFGRDGDDYFLALEHLDGQPLHLIERRMAKKRATISREAFYLVVADALAGLHYAHELRDFDGKPLELVHRDVTPHNIFVTYDGFVKVVDFGIAKAVGRLAETQHGLVKGKIRYMSPEQAAGLPIDRRTDVFAAGLLLFQAATGERFWAKRDEFEIPLALVGGDYDASPRSVDPTVPKPIDAICRRALAFRREERYATAAEMQADIERFLGDRSAPLRRDLAALQQRLFERTRARLWEVVEKAAGKRASLSDAEHDPTLVSARHPPPGSPETTPLVEEAPTVRVAEAPRPRSAAPRQRKDERRARPPPRTREGRAKQGRRGLWLLALGIAAAAGVTIFFAVRLGPLAPTEPANGAATPRTRSSGGPPSSDAGIQKGVPSKTSPGKHQPAVQAP